MERIKILVLRAADAAWWRLLAAAISVGRRASRKPGAMASAEWFVRKGWSEVDKRRLDSALFLAQVAKAFDPTYAGAICWVTSICSSTI